MNNVRAPSRLLHKYNKIEDFAAYDALPAAVRRIVAEAPMNFGCVRLKAALSRSKHPARTTENYIARKMRKLREAATSGEQNDDFRPKRRGS